MFKALNLKSWVKGDVVLWVVIFFLSIMSLLVVYSSTGRLAYSKAGGDYTAYLLRHGFFLLGAGVIMFVFTNFISIKLLSKSARTLVIITVGFLCFALVQKYLSGHPTNRSVHLFGFSFQPAELAKISLVLYAAKMFSSSRDEKTVTRKAFWRVTLIMCVICAFIALGDTSTAFIVGFGAFSLMLIAGVKAKDLAILVGGLMLLGIGTYYTAPYLPEGVGRVHTIRARIDDFVHGDKDLEIGTTQARYGELAIYEGGLLGKGAGQSDVKNYMEAGYNDFIYAIIIEEYGSFIGIVVMVLYLIILYRGGIIARNAKRSFAAFVVLGLTLVYSLQAFINMGVSAGAFPVTGQPLPWVSMGGSSMWLTACGFGIILAVSYQSNKKLKEMPEIPYEEGLKEQDEEIKEE